MLRISERSLALENDAYTEPGIVTNKKELPLMKVNRRTFVSAGVSGVAAATTTGLGARSALGANNRIRVASIGVGGMGRSDLRDFLKMPEVDIVAVCDTFPRGTGPQRHRCSHYSDARPLARTYCACRL